MKILLAAVFLAAIFCRTGAGQSFEWNGLTLDASAPADAMRLLGAPKKEKTETIVGKIPESVRVKNNNQTALRRLFFKNGKDFEEAVLTFYNDRLVEIKFSPKKKTLPASTLGGRYDADFLFVERFAKNMRLADLEGQKETSVPKVYPGFYSMISVKPNLVVLAWVDNNTWKTVWRDATGKPTAEMFPGYVADVQIASRSLEEK